MKTEFEQQRTALQASRRSLQDIGVGTANLARSQASLQQRLEAATAEVQAQSRVTRSFAVLGVRSIASVEQEVQRLEAAYRELAASGRVGFADLSRAHQRMHLRIRELRGEMGALDQTMGGMGGTVRAFLGAFAGLAAVQATTSFIKGSVVAFAGFDDVMRQVGATSGATSEELQALTDLAKAMGTTTRFSASQAAEGLRAMSLAGLSAREQMEALPKVLELAAAGSVDMETAAGIATAAMAQFGLEARELGRVNDLLVTAFTNSATDIQGLGLSLQYAGPVAKAAGQSFQETATVLAILAKNGFSGEKAGTALRAAFARLLDPVDKAKEAIDKLGLQTRDSAGKLLPMTQILRNLRDAGADAADMIRIFGVEAAPALTAAVGMSAEAMEALVSQFSSVEGTAARVAQQMEAGLGGTLRSMESAWEGVRIAVGEAIAEHQSVNLQALTAAINENKDALIELAVAGVDLAAILARVGLEVGQFLLEWKEVILALGAVAVVSRTVTLALRVLTAIGMSRWFATGTLAARAFASAVGAQGLAGAASMAAGQLKLLASVGLTRFLFSGTVGAQGLMLALGRAGLAGAALVAVGSIVRLGSVWLEYRSAQEQATRATEMDVAWKKRLADHLAEVSRQTGLTIQDVATLERLQREGVIVADQLNGTWRAATTALGEHSRAVQDASVLQGELAQATKRLTELEEEYSEVVKREQQEALQSRIQAAERSASATRNAIQESMRLEEQYAARVIRLTDELSRLQSSAADRRREIVRRGMSDAQAEADQQQEAWEKIRRAKELAAQGQSAINAGDIESAARLAEESKRVAEQAQSMASGLRNNRAALQAFDEATRVVVDAQRQLVAVGRENEATQKAQTANLRTQLQVQVENLQALQDALDQLDESRTSIDIQAEIDQAMTDIRRIQAALDAIPREVRTRHVIETTQARRFGGVIHALARGGRLPGWGGGDRVPAMLEPGEFVIRKERTRLFGDLLAAINAAPLSVVNRMISQVPRFQLGGFVDGLSVPKLAMAGAAGGAGGENVTISFQVGRESFGGFSGDRNVLRELSQALNRARLGR